MIADSLADIAAESLKILIPVEPLAEGVAPVGKYCAVMHAKLCRMKFIGLSDGAAAKAVGINSNTLREWRKRYPKLACDMDQAVELSNAHAAMILRKLMEGDGATAFNAVKFYLTTHSPEFKESQKVDVTVDVGETMRQIRSAMYGLPAEPKPAEPALPVIDVPAAPAAEGEDKEASKVVVATEPELAIRWDDL